MRATPTLPDDLLFFCGMPFGKAGSGAGRGGSVASAATQQHLRRLGAHGSSFNFSEGEEVALGALGSERVETAPAEIASSSHDAISVIRTGCRKRRVIKKPLKIIRLD